MSFSNPKILLNGGECPLSVCTLVSYIGGDLIFNGHQKHFDTKEVSFILDVSDDAVQGNNVIKIRPKKTLEIRELRVDLVR